jgi:hypothetical protein
MNVKPHAPAALPHIYRLGGLVTPTSDLAPAVNGNLTASHFTDSAYPGSSGE